MTNTNGQPIVDVLMITYNRPHYTRLALTRLLETCDARTRVWLWHNGDHAETLDVVRQLSSHPRVHAFHHSAENKKLREPTNWFWTNADGKYLSKIDDDNLMPAGWVRTLRAAHESEPKLGVIGCWSFRPEDHQPDIAERKVQTLRGGHAIMRNCWVAGTGHLIRRACVEELGPIRDGQTFTSYCVELAARGWINGWYYPFVYMENMDDPRSAFTMLKSEADFAASRGLSAQRFGITTLEQYRRRQPVLAAELQRISYDPRHYRGWQGRVRRAIKRVHARLRPQGVIAP